MRFQIVLIGFKEKVSENIMIFVTKVQQLKVMLNALNVIINDKKRSYAEINVHM